MARRTQHGQHHVGDSKVKVRAQGDGSDTYSIMLGQSAIITARLYVPVAKSVCSNTAGHILQIYCPDRVRMAKGKENTLKAVTHHSTTAKCPCKEGGHRGK
jgi:hypothetical protein